MGEALWAQYFEIDRRLLAAFRIWFGLVLLFDILVRFPALTLFYTNDGVLPNYDALLAPLSQPIFSVFFACSTKGEVAVAFTLTALVYVGLIVGYRTKTMQILTLIVYPSLMSRNLFFEMGGSCSLAIAAGWTVFLPLGDRFSIDAMRKSLAKRHELTASALNDRRAMAPDRTPHASLVVAGLLLQVTAIYFFNCVQKVDATWRSGDAVHWVLWQNRIATRLCGIVRMHEPRWLSPMLSWATLIVEGSAPLMLLTPFSWRWTRSIFALVAVVFHAGLALFVDIGPYSYVMFAFDLLVLPGFWFDRAGAWLRKRRIAQCVVYDPTDPALHMLARVLARLDTFELIRFVDDGDASVGASSLVDGLKVTPFGGALALPPLRWIVRTVVRLRVPLAKMLACPPGVLEGRAAVDEVWVERPRGLRRGRVWAREALAALFMFITLMQIAHDNWWLGNRLPASWRGGPPGVLGTVPVYLRQLQGWMMFTVPPRTDGTIIVDAETIDGRHIDPFTGKPPDFDVALHGPRLYGQLFCDYFIGIADPDNERYRKDLAHYLNHWQELEGRPARDRLRAYRVLWVESDSPPFGKTEPTHVRMSVILGGSPIAS
jgi:hypothetical protein